MQIEVKNLSSIYFKKSKNPVHALHDVSLSIEKNDFVALIGETGSGKSTLVQHFNALIVPDEGEVKVDDYVLRNKKNKNIKKLRKLVGVVFQFPEYQLFEETVEKDVAFGPKNFGDDEETALKKAHEALLSVGLDESYFTKSPFDLSGGEKRRVAIAGILALNPEILALDEPTAGLDPVGREIILSLLNKLHDEGKTIIIVTHDMSIVMENCNKVIVLKDGHLKYLGKPSNLFETDLEGLSIEVPPFYKMAKLLKEKGYNLDLSKITSQDILLETIKNGGRQ